MEKLGCEKFMMSNQQVTDYTQLLDQNKLNVEILHKIFDRVVQTINEEVEKIKREEHEQ